jgi:diguanylate cyclase (GGDEF)-like protein/PAS domain S-box-containing protein
MNTRSASFSLFKLLQEQFAGTAEPLHCTKASLIHFSHALEETLLRERLPALVFAGFQEQAFWAGSADRYAAIGRVARAVCIFTGGDLPRTGSAGEILISLDEHDALRNEWFIVIFSERFCVVFCAADRQLATGEDRARIFAAHWSFEASMAGDACKLLLEAVDHYRPDQAAHVRAVHGQITPRGAELRIMSRLTREIMRFEEDLHTALRNNEARYRTLSNLISDFVLAITIAPSGMHRLSWASGALAAITGYEPGAPQMRNGLEQVIHPEDRSIWEAHCQRVTGGESDECELRIVTGSGETRWLQLSSQPDINQRPLRQIILAARDITVRKEAEAELQRANEQLKRWVANLEQRTREMTLLNEMGEWLQTCQTSEEAYGVIAQFAVQLFPATSGALYARREQTDNVEIVAGWGEERPEEQSFTLSDCWGLRRGRTYMLQEAGGGIRCRHLPELARAGSLCIPLSAQGETLGLLHLRSTWGAGGEPAAQAALGDLHGLAIIVAEHLSLALSNVQLRETLRQQAIRDPLTGLFNRRYMEESIEREVRRVQRSGSSLGVIMLDLDQFKRFNDTFTHLAGDMLLREIGALLQHAIRSEDIACRYGGEEFTLILPDATLDDTYRRAQILHQGIKALQLEYRGQSLGTITVSIGLASFPDHGDSGEAVLRIADTALLRAKASGRDQICIGGV